MNVTKGVMDKRDRSGTDEYLREEDRTHSGWKRAQPTAHFIVRDVGGRWSGRRDDEELCITWKKEQFQT